MPGDIIKKFSERAEALLKDAKSIEERCELGGVGFPEVHEVASRARMLIHAMSGPESAYAESLSDAMKQESCKAQFGALEGVLRALCRDLSDRNLVTFRHEVEMAVIYKILSQAKRLIRAKGTHPSAVVIVACSAAEEFLRNWCEEKGIEVPERQKSIAKFTQALRANGQINLPVEQRVNSWEDCRNDAVRGASWENITQETANRLVREVEEFVMENREVLG
ncbi:hypothetical protein SVA_2862 [Sulfurifustis variabilis]|uniref:Uncharacterized protein n=1 Tax=Sulfurifustis variabilis TaxID=1675686 RepID=A0A1B4V799_9GAMM|nr:hypothetical protein [Sulfurifustis variabilis]BAU49410.1 hypothetical protein SVA_2862 [Sulfurifustis variabilis]